MRRSPVPCACRSCRPRRLACFPRRRHLGERDQLPVDRPGQSAAGFRRRHRVARLGGGAGRGDGDRLREVAVDGNRRDDETQARHQEERSEGEVDPPGDVEQPEHALQPEGDREVLDPARQGSSGAWLTCRSWSSSFSCASSSARGPSTPGRGSGRRGWPSALDARFSPDVVPIGHRWAPPSRGCGSGDFPGVSRMSLPQRPKAHDRRRVGPAPSNALANQRHRGAVQITVGTGVVVAPAASVIWPLFIFTHMITTFTTRI